MVDYHETNVVEEGETTAQSLIQGRAKRTTAGRHMATLLNAEAEDDLALLFEEVENDNEFDDADAEGGEDDDVLDSSSDDEDQGPNAQDGDFEGEQELQKEARAEIKKRKKQQQTFNLQSLRKRVKIDPAAVSSSEPAPRPKKKSERISWVPTVDEGPTRSSSRRQTMHNKQLTHARLKDSEQKRVKLIATMEEAAKRKANSKPKEMTQAERLAEAERVERHNSKSLNRWEEMEKRKADERRAKIEALQNRRLEGPVMSYWSGVATWVNGRLTRVGNVDVTHKPKSEDNFKKNKRDKEKKPAVEAPGPGFVPENAQGPALGNGEDPTQPAQQVDPNTAQTLNSGQDISNGDKTTQETPTPAVPAEAPTDATVQLSSEIADGVPSTDTGAKRPSTVECKGSVDKAPADEAPRDAMDIDGKPAETAQIPAPQIQPTSHPEEPPKAEYPQPRETKSDTAPQETLPPATTLAPEIEASSAATAAPVVSQPDKVSMPTPQEQLGPEIHTDHPVATNEGARVLIPEGPPPPPPTIEQTGRTLTVLENFDDKTAHSRDYSIYFNAKKPSRLTKISSSLCVITSLPSRYRDPETSLPFANSYAHKEIRHTVDQRYVWSSMLGCYIGPTGVAARGVPERFLGSSSSQASTPPTAGARDDPN